MGIGREGLASVVIPVRNGGMGLRRCLESLRVQQISGELEVIVVDSGSTDGSVSLARSFGARTHEIDPSAFNHGATRNLGARLASGEIVVFTVDDAEWIGERSLQALIEAVGVGAPKVAGAYARQVARAQAPAHQRRYIDHRFGTRPRTQRAGSREELTVATTLFSNVASAIPRDVLERYPFASDLIIAEDLEWCARVMLAGHAIAYVPEAVVRHSHDYSLAGAFQRYFDQGVAAERSFLAPGGSSARAVRSEGLRFVRGEIADMWRRGERRAIPAAIAHEASRFTGFQLGRHHRLLPPPVRRRLSRTKAYWAG